MEKYDIVYILKNGIWPDELRYSLRSLKNFPHGKVIFAGGVPEGLKPDIQIYYQQTGFSKYSKARSTYNAILANNQISENFWLFNDDFFVMQPVSEYGTPYDETLFEKIIRIEDKYRTQTNYTLRLRNAARWLRDHGYDVKNYELHLPMLMNKTKLRSLPADNSLPLRSIYGNVYETGVVNRRDVKIQDTGVLPDPDADFLSTSDRSFRYGKVGEYIRNYFNEPCRYEVNRHEDN